VALPPFAEIADGIGKTPVQLQRLHHHVSVSILEILPRVENQSFHPRGHEQTVPLVRQVDINGLWTITAHK